MLYFYLVGVDEFSITAAMAVVPAAELYINVLSIATTFTGTCIVDSLTLIRRRFSVWTHLFNSNH